MGDEKPAGERVAILETEMRQARRDIIALEEAIKKIEEKPKSARITITMQEWLIIGVVLANFALTIFKGIGWSP